MIILGIDPGLANTGWGVIEADGGRYRPISYGVVRTESGGELPKRISLIASSVGRIAREYAVQAVAMEDIFFAQNISSSISVAKVIGAVTHECLTRGLEVCYFTPLQVKMAITGMGRADKNQVQQMVMRLLKLDKPPRPDHAADALADCITYAINASTMARMKGALK